jgi:hypothetical protein
MLKKLSLVFLLLGLSIGAHAQESFTLANSATGTTVSKLAKVVVNGGVPQAQIVATTDTSGAVGIVAPDPNSGAGTSGQVVITRSGIVPCVFDNTVVAGDFVQIASGVAGDCHDAGASRPTSGQIIGIVIQTGGSAGTYNVLLDKSILPSASGTPTPICAAVGSSDVLSAAGTFATVCPIPATAISGVGQILKITVHGVFSSGAGSPSMNMQVNAGGTTALCTSNGTGATMSGIASASNLEWDVSCYVQIITTGAPGTALSWGFQDIANSLGGNLVNHALCNANPCTAGTDSFITNSTQNVSVQESAVFASGQTMQLQTLTVTNYSN